MGNEVASYVEVLHLQGDVELALAAAMEAVGVLGGACPHGSRTGAVENREACLGGAD